MEDLRQKAINYVLGCFESMGANQQQLCTEQKRLSTDDGYLDQWAAITGFSD